MDMRGSTCTCGMGHTGSGKPPKKSGMPTRSEITDAIQASLAECIMINKGEHTISVLESLKEIMLRTSGSRNKKKIYPWLPVHGPDIHSIILVVST